MTKKSFKFDPTGKTTIKNLKSIDKKEQKEDGSYLSDVFQRLVDGEYQVDSNSEMDYEMPPKEAAEWIFEHVSEIIKLGQEGWNPFDTLDIILYGKPSEGWPAN